MSQISSYGSVYLNCSAELFPFQAEIFDLRKRLAVLSSYFFFLQSMKELPFSKPN